MQPVYLDLHIHTSENPDRLDGNYDVTNLIGRVNDQAQGAQFLISLTDHNAINKNAYLSLISLTRNVILGAELHIRYSDDRPPYHCHIYFDIPVIESTVIDRINSVLDALYPQKAINPGTTTLPAIEEILRRFHAFEFLLLPHGGQSHSTFDTAVSPDCRFDSAMERSIGS